MSPGCSTLSSQAVSIISTQRKQKSFPVSSLMLQDVKKAFPPNVPQKRVMKPERKKNTQNLSGDPPIGIGILPTPTSRYWSYVYLGTAGNRNWII